MKLVAEECPRCGGPVTVIATDARVTCAYCRTSLRVEHEHDERISRIADAKRYAAMTMLWGLRLESLKYERSLMTDNELAEAFAKYRASE